ncbi:MAG: hypothetical protein EGR34_05315 [Prevotella sp.]|nr:hypothetical protein [Prevotella sp.]
MKKKGCVISLDYGSRSRAESPKAPSPGHGTPARGGERAPGQGFGQEGAEDEGHYGDSRIWLHRLMKCISEAREKDESVWITII